MGKKLLLLFFLYRAPCILLALTGSEACIAQSPLVKVWDYRYGGVQLDWLNAFITTDDGGFMLAGYSQSGISGDKSQPSQGMNDIWIVKLDSNGLMQWDKTFGGTANDVIFSIAQTRDGGYILGGSSLSGVSGDKSDASFGGYDYWVIKIDSAGNKEWDKDFGGDLADQLNSILQTSDGGYVFGGFSESGATGNRTHSSRGFYDYWVVKTDSLGTKLWDQAYGGNSTDWLFSIAEAADGGLLLGGESYSQPSGEKSQANWDASGFTCDMWVVKTDAGGIKQWDKTFGGTNYDRLFSIAKTGDGGYALGGLSLSGISGDKTQPTYGDFDFWMLKVDSAGTLLWDMDYGGSQLEDEFGKVIRTMDGGFALAGTSYSPIGGSKTENNLGTEQSWILKTDSAGNLQWDNTIFTTGHDETGFIQQTSDGCLVVANSTLADSGGYKSQPSWSATLAANDYWIVKFCPSVLANFSTATALCPGTCADFLNLSVNAASYQWYFQGAQPDTSTAASPVNICYFNPGTWDVTLIAANATGSDTLYIPDYITVYPQPPPQGISQNGDTLFANPGATSYQWYFGGTMINGATDYFYVAQSSGDYNVVATDGNGCEVEAAIFSVVASTWIEVSGLRFEVFPNPAHETLFVNCYWLSGTAVDISVYNVMGEKKMQIQESGCKIEEPGIKNQEVKIDVSHFETGMYIIEVTSGSKTYRTKFVKQ